MMMRIILIHPAVKINERDNEGVVAEIVIALEIISAINAT